MIAVACYYDVEGSPGYEVVLCVEKRHLHRPWQALTILVSQQHCIVLDAAALCVSVLITLLPVNVDHSVILPLGVSLSAVTLAENCERGRAGSSKLLLLFIASYSPMVTYY